MSTTEQFNTMPPIKDWIFTFGSNHLLGLNRCVIMQSMTYEEARMFMVDMVGPKWSMQYDLAHFKKESAYYFSKMTTKLEFTRDNLPGDLRDTRIK